MNDVGFYRKGSMVGVKASIGEGVWYDKEKDVMRSKWKSVVGDIFIINGEDQV